MIRRIARALAFARHVPPQQILRRGMLLFARRRDERWPPDLTAAAMPALRTDLPLPILPPRSGMVHQMARGWRFVFLGHEEQYDAIIDWHRQPAVRSGQLWRMNLHYMEYLEELPDAACMDIVRQWLVANPPFSPGAHHDSWNAYAASLRVVVLAQQLAVRRSRLSDADTALLAHTILVHLRFLQRRLETDIGGNHLIKNIKALAWGSALFEGAEAETIGAMARRLLTHAIREQFLSDGFHFELSTSYHAQVTADLLETRHAIAANVPPALDETLRRALAALAAMRHPDGLPAQFGDAGLHMSYPPDAILAAAAQYALVAQNIPIALPDAGYWMFRQGNDALFFDAGPIAADALPAHGHGDALSFEWSVASQRIFVDQGVMEYVAGSCRQSSRTVHYHNTLGIAGFDQADFFGAFRIGSRARVGQRILRHDAEILDIEGWHDGFRRKGGPLHHRHLTAAYDSLRIEDRLDMAMDGAACRLLLHPDVVVDQVSHRRCILTTGPVRILFDSEHPVDIVDARWWPDMGFEQATRRIVISLPVSAQTAWIECRVETRGRSGTT